MLFPFPGIGELTNRDTKKGLKHLGIDIVLTVAAAVLTLKKILPFVMNNLESSTEVFAKKGLFSKEFLKATYKDVSKKTLLGATVIAILGTANTISAAIGTYKGKQAE